MGKFFVKTNQIEENKINILNDDVNHIKNVLRLNVLDNIEICNKDTGDNYNCKISNILNNSIECNIINKIDSTTEGNVKIDVYQGLPKFDKMELIIQKGTELGVTNFIPVKFNRCIVKIDKKDENKKIDRWQKIAEVASKQSGRDFVPNVKKVIGINEICDIINKYDIVFLAYELENNNFIKNELSKLKGTKEQYNIAIIIGPEGGLEEKEVKILETSGAKVVSLGKRILRTETASMQMVSIIMYELEDINT